MTIITFHHLVLLEMRLKVGVSYFICKGGESSCVATDSWQLFYWGWFLKTCLFWRLYMIIWTLLLYFFKVAIMCYSRLLFFEDSRRRHIQDHQGLHIKRKLIILCQKGEFVRFFEKYEISFILFKERWNIFLMFRIFYNIF